MEQRLEEKKYLVITSINNMTIAMDKYASLADWDFILVGDKKGPKVIKDDRINYLDIHKQAGLGFKYYSNCPENHYARKNIGYLYAMANGATIIAESDDDNIPKEDWGSDINFEFDDLEVFDNATFFNVYSEFCDSKIWPRGYPLEKIMDNNKKNSCRRKVNIGIWQQLADEDPDVDAIYRLTNSDSIKFKSRDSFALEKRVYCPFNSQNTFWTRKAFPFMYLPKTVTFRFTDILRGYISQRLLWEEDLLLGFGGASVWQARNEHNLISDFKDEVPMYLSVVSIVERMEALNLLGTSLENLYNIYEVLAKDRIVGKSELMAVESWIEDLQSFGFK